MVIVQAITYTYLNTNKTTKPNNTTNPNINKVKKKNINFLTNTNIFRK